MPKRYTCSVNKVTAEDWAYLAGYVDGEGCISAPATNHYTCYKPRLHINQSHQPSLREIQEVFGVGTIYDKELEAPRHNRSTWVVFRGEEVMWLLRGLYPYLRLKKRQARWALKIMRRHSEWTITQRVHAALMLSNMKKEGLVLGEKNSS